MAEPEAAPTGARVAAVDFVARARAARLAAGRSQSQFARQLVAAGLDAWRQQTVGKVESGQRELTLAEGYAIAELLDVPLVEAAAGGAVATARPVGGSPVVEAVESDLEALGDLVGIEPSLAAVALALARQMDAPDGGTSLPSLARELRAVLAELASGRQGDDEDDDDLAAPD
ncbi:helix-turn-helix transcriptional regulator [Frankia sp. AgB1.9]|uniref:helix-turn-helix domain-containing protein n=1 Tax=unclassified Frankia TaxID=2632575 RepID=UPI0019317F1D|nr:MULTISPECIES: helix-turn-helix transcriptional regulator [unclassified Frankia]MBL7494461.1 helix-turn-helix transcriptional regulator [Frankia sp. AgW1.1]MBL7546633.1 helix-turn-helix transcriptional regulator [Frankia sp. AgB1.9]MBL7622381.1 helix-turn-helix transcriptional regulator [Frankia sp. AgB1.8]